ncbi:MAG: acyl carrier protein phosphodiesterase [bacterium]|nr:acyl carrier protein phosphodiesterase [bacterium]
MNFLAHIYLSGENEPLKIGNFIGDFVKGNMMDDFSPEIRKGILLHREIDSFTDKHPIVKESKNRLRDKYGHYAGVITDIYYDHYLALDWKKYHDEDLLSYTESFYSLMSGYKNIVPERVNHMLGYMKRDNWLYNYQYFDGINRVLHGMSRRTKFDSKMDEAIVELKKDHKEYHAEFNDFFPELMEHCTRFIEKHD